MVVIVAMSLGIGRFAVELQKERPLPCGCFGARAVDDPPGAIRRQLAMSIARNMLLICAAAWVFMAARPARRCARFDPMCPSTGRSIAAHSANIGGS